MRSVTASSVALAKARSRSDRPPMARRRARSSPPSDWGATSLAGLRCGSGGAVAATGRLVAAASRLRPVAAFLRRVLLRRGFAAAGREVGDADFGVVLVDDGVGVGAAGCAGRFAGRRAVGAGSGLGELLGAASGPD